MYGEKGIGAITLMDLASCEIWTSIRAAETGKHGSTDDLSALTSDLNDWRLIKLRIANGTLTYFYDNVVKYTLPYEGEIGNVIGLSVTHRGSGQIDWVKLSNSTNNTVVYEEDFNNCQTNCNASFIPPGGSNAKETFSNLQLTTHPNPFKNQATIEYYLPESSVVNLQLVDLFGRKVKTLTTNAEQHKGWYQLQLEANDLPLGTYYLVLNSNGVMQTKPLVLVR